MMLMKHGKRDRYAYREMDRVERELKRMIRLTDLPRALFSQTGAHLPGETDDLDFNGSAAARMI